MQTARFYTMNLLRRLARRLPAFSMRRLSPAALMRVSGIARVAVPVISRAWIASMGQPSPTTGFALALMLELGGCLLHLPGIRIAIARSARAVALAVTAAIFHVAAEKRSQAAGVLRPRGTGNSIIASGAALRMPPGYCRPGCRPAPMRGSMDAGAFHLSSTWHG
jgi:uncharacterized membrane protein YphA (DoxX/SURF4 family)